MHPSGNTTAEHVRTCRELADKAKCEIASIEVLELQPNDRLLVKVPKNASQDEMRNLKECIQRWSELPTGRIAIMRDEIEITVFRESTNVQPDLRHLGTSGGNEASQEASEGVRGNG